MPLDNKTPAYPGDSTINIEDVAVVEEAGYSKKNITCNTHCGTHIDAPIHMVVGGKDLAGEVTIGNNVQIGENAIVLPGVRIGNNSIISGNYIFEKESGKITIGNNTFIGGGMFICIEEIEIGNDVMFSWGCTVMDNDSHSLIWEERKTDVVDWKI